MRLLCVGKQVAQEPTADLAFPGDLLAMHHASTRKHTRLRAVLDELDAADAHELFEQRGVARVGLERRERDVAQDRDEAAQITKYVSTVQEGYTPWEE